MTAWHIQYYTILYCHRGTPMHIVDSLGLLHVDHLWGKFSNFSSLFVPTTKLFGFVIATCLEGGGISIRWCTGGQVRSAGPGWGEMSTECFVGECVVGFPGGVGVGGVGNGVRTWLRVCACLCVRVLFLMGGWVVVCVGGRGLWIVLCTVFVWIGRGWKRNGATGWEARESDLAWRGKCYPYGSGMKCGIRAYLSERNGACD